MPDIFSRNPFPAYYAVPKAFRATIGAAAVTAFPAPATQAALQALTGVQASATMLFAAQPAANSTVTVNGVAVVFVAPGAGGFSLRGQALSGTILSTTGVPLPWQAVGVYGLQCEIAAGGVTATLLNLVGLLRALPDEALPGVQLRLRGGNTIVVSAAQTGTAGNAIALAASAGSGVTITPAGGSASTATASAAAAGSLAGGAAPTSGYAVLVEPGPQPVELTGVNAVCRASQAAGTLTLFKSDGTVLSKVPQGAITFGSGNTLSSTQELAAIPFPLITPAATLVVQPWTGLYAYGSTTQVIDIEAAPAGSY